MQNQESKPKYKQMEVYPDRELLVWEKWIEIRKEETLHLAQKTDRPPADLTMNLLEKIREDKERKIVLEHAQIEKKPTVRGYLWEQPQRLKQGCYCENVYEIQRTKEEKGLPRVIQHIGVPKYIQETEKGIIGVPERKPCGNLDHEYMQYREKRENDLKEQIKKIDPFRPDIDELLVRGNKPKPAPPKIPPLPKVTLSTVITRGDEATCSIYALKINNSLFIKDIHDHKISHLRAMQKELCHESCNTWSYYFNTPINRAGRCKLFVKNPGTVMIKYCWKKIKRSLPFIPEEPLEQVFFFNKNEGSLYPGQEKELCFTFISDKPGIYNEIWELSTSNVCFFDTLTEKFIINLTGDSVENIERLIRKAGKLEGKINHAASRNIIMSLIDDTITKAVSIKPEAYPYKKLLLEKDMFIMKNPVCFYHQTEVTNLRDLYSEMLPNETWDLSITSWRSAMVEKEYDDRMKYYELLRKSHLHLLKPWYEEDDIMQEKYRAVNILLGQLIDKFDYEYFRIRQLILNLPEGDTSETTTVSNIFLEASPMDFTIRNIFYVKMYEHVATTMEMCAGILSNLDLNRWLQFDFCRL
ncbi:MYCBP-associated protein [Pieris rapae]|uniref:MYCBP-associated protein n=1 Tax=Pieris rapae TaxID=64459 RepID=UPI001E27C25A|nr:MYCBP-associated protein [Pieris rapae]